MISDETNSGRTSLPETIGRQQQRKLPPSTTGNNFLTTEIMIEGKLWNREGHDDHEDEEQESSGSGFGAVSVNNGRRRTRSLEGKVAFLCNPKKSSLVRINLLRYLCYIDVIIRKTCSYCTYIALSSIQNGVNLHQLGTSEGCPATAQ